MAVLRCKHFLQLSLTSMNLNEIQQHLVDRKLPVVAEATGLSVFTLYRVVNGKGRPSKSTLRSIENYLRQTGAVALNG